MAKYRKKPVVIDALQFPARNSEEALAFLEGCTGWHQTDEGIVIPTLEGEMLARKGDWIIKSVKGEYYPCKPDIFEATYEAVQ